MEAKSERDLVYMFKEAKKVKDMCTVNLDEAKAKLQELESEIVEFLQDKQATSTSKFEGLGYVQLNKPRLYANCNNENMDQLLEYVKLRGRDDMIKTVVMSQTLSQFIGEMVENGEEVPKFVNYYLKPQVRIY